MAISESKKKIVIDNYFKSECDMNTSIKEAFTKGFELGLKKAPIPQPKTGHWIEKNGYDGDTYYDCSECGESWTTIDGTPWDDGMKYCPNCGAKMIEEE